LGYYVVNQTIYESLSNFLPIPALERDDSDEWLLFLEGNHVRFFEPFSDDWYRATVPGSPAWSENIDGGIPTYELQEAASPMACVQQYQFCYTGLPENSRCSPLGGIFDAIAQAAQLFNLTQDEALNNMTVENNALGNYFLWFLAILTADSMAPYTIIATLGPQALASTQSLQGGFQAEIPENQWQLDILNVWATYLASVQASFVETATGPTNSQLDPFLWPPGNDDQKALCNKQVRYPCSHVPLPPTSL
jgi:hypothetical protein